MTSAPKERGNNSKSDAIESKSRFGYLNAGSIQKTLVGAIGLEPKFGKKWNCNRPSKIALF
jgi:hypothetical protein